MIEVLTTFHAAGWEQYGKRMVETFLQYWPADIKIHLYCEDVQTGLKDTRVVEHDIFAVCPQAKNFVAAHNNDHNNGIRDGVRDFKYDAVKFCSMPQDQKFKGRHTDIHRRRHSDLCRTARRKAHGSFTR